MRRLMTGLILALCLAALAVVGGARGSNPQPLGLEEADRFYEERSYAKALAGYRQALEAGLAGERQTELEYRVAVCLGRSQQWDEAFAQIEAFIDAHPRGTWGARGHYWLGQLYSVAEHCGYRLGETLYRGEDYPELETAEKPEHQCLCGEDAEKAVAAFERAKQLYERLAPREETEEADLNFDLAGVLAGRDLTPMVRALHALAKEERPGLTLRLGPADPADVGKLRGHDWTPTPERPYDSTQPLPQRILGLLGQIERLEDGRRAPQARLARALYLARYQRQMQRQMRAYDEKKGEWVELPFPYQEIDALTLLESVPGDFPKHPISPQVQLTVGQWFEGQGHYVKAVAAYERLIDRWPESKWVSDAHDRIQELRYPWVRIERLAAPPGEQPLVRVNGRNVRTITLTARRVQLEDILLAPRVLNSANTPWSNFARVFGHSPADRGRLGAEVARWRHDTGDTGDHRPFSAQIGVPVQERGAYLIEADAGEAHAATFVLHTDLALVLKTDKDRALAFVCDAETGKPVPGADVVLRERYRRGGGWHVGVERGQVNADGLKGKPLTTGGRREDQRLEAFAWVGDRYAVAGDVCRRDRGGVAFEEYRGHVTTDRPVYRPGDRVHFRVVIMARTMRDEREVGEWQPAPDLEFEVTVHDRRGEKIHQSIHTTSEFGTIDGSLTLGEEAALGEYRVDVRLTSVEPPFAQISGNRFRVEEYKKPEFEVTVTPGAEQLRVGESVKATVEARYYFGSPVAGAQVTYRVFRTAHYPYFHFARAYDWLTGLGPRRRGMHYRRGEVVKEGEGRTDEEGRLTIELATASGGQWPDARAYSYTVEAEVTDESRRTITGTGEVRASKQQFFAFLDLKRGFYEAGDRIEVEVATRDVMDRPVAASGRIVVERVVATAAPGGIVEAQVHEAPVETDEHGRGFFRWTCDRAGQYRLTFKAMDKWEEEVTASAYTYVHGPDSHLAAFRHRGIELIPETRTYQEGGTCRLLIVSSLPDATVLLTQEAGHQILARAVLPVGGKTRVVEVQLKRNHVPHFRFSAVAVKNWRAYEASADVFVPPVRRFLDVTVSSDREEYRPGERATFRVKATDWQGKPVRAEFSLGVIDASLLYIQPEYAPDIRAAFYADRRDACIPRRWSLEWHPGQWSKTDRTRHKYRRHEAAMPEDMGQLQDWPHYGGVFQPHWIQDGFIAYKPLAALGRAVHSREEMDRAAAGGFGGGGAGLAAPKRSDPMLSFEPPPEGPPRPSEGELAAAEVRTRFADTAYWSPAVVTDEDGAATVTVTMPENLTTWKATARGLTTEVQVGEGSAECVTTKDVIVRLQAPRFFMERDLVALSANVHNYLTSEKAVKVSLALEGGCLDLIEDVPADLGPAEPAAEPSVWVTVPADGERRVDWVVRVVRSGTATVTMTAQTDEESDAVEMQFPALVHGVEKFEVQSGVMRDIDGTRTVTLRLDLPAERRRGATELNVQLTPSLAAITLDALPYLADYPYGCIEQTMSRFMPSAIVARTLTDLGIDLEDLGKRAELYARELEGAGATRERPDSAYTYPGGMPGSLNAEELASRMHLRRARGPIFDPAKLGKMVRQGLARIYAKQKPDGGWGWWPSDLSDPYMTAYVCHGLFTAREAGWDIKDDVLEKGFQFLVKAIKEDDNLHRMAYVASVLALRGSVDDEVKSIISDRLYRNRMKLTPYSQALLALALWQIAETGEARVLVDNLENTAHIDRENGTCNWMPRRRGWWWWHWWDSPVETNAAVLRAYLAVYPDGELAPMIVKWMVNNRRGSHWSSTKETALAVYALADYMRIKRELAPDYTITVDLEGKVQRTYRVNRDNALFFDNRFIVGDEVMGDGPQTLTITVSGEGTLYYSAYLQYFSLEEDITGGGNEIFVRRRYFKLIPRLVEKTVKERKWRELAYDREELFSGAHLQSGDLVEVELIIESKNDYEHLVFEDMKPAGCEPVALRSGAGEGAGVYSYMELRDEKVAFFITNMPQGTRAVRYRLRAEIPGDFHALPTNGYSMYAPDVRCLSDEWRVGVSD